MPPSESPILGPLLQGAFAGPQEFAHWVRSALHRASEDGWSQMVWSDPNFEDWPLREQQVVQSLDAWARRGRKLTMLARRFDAMARLHPRFVAWRQRWDQVIECRVCRDISDAHMPSALWSPVWVLRRTDVERCAGSAGFEPRRRRAVQEELEERKRQSTLGFSASVLGL
jgi:hypothetical protein